MCDFKSKHINHVGDIRFMISQRIDEDNLIGLLSYFIDNFNLTEYDIGTGIDYCIENISSAVMLDHPNVDYSENIEYTRNCIRISFETYYNIHNMNVDNLEYGIPDNGYFDYINDILHIKRDIVEVLLELDGISDFGKHYYHVNNGDIFTHYELDQLLVYIFTDLVSTIALHLKEKLITIIEGVLLGSRFIYSNIILTNSVKIAPYPNEIIIVYNIVQ